jgi:hypothetical protein
VQDYASIQKYLQRGPLAQSVSGQTTENATDRATWSLGKYQEPSVRVRTVQVDAHSYPLCFTSVLQTDIADIATTIRQPVGAPGAYQSLPVVTERVSTQIGPGKWSVTYQQSPYVPEDAVLVADSTGFNLLGSNSLPWLRRAHSLYLARERPAGHRQLPQRELVHL